MTKTMRLLILIFAFQMVSEALNIYGIGEYLTFIELYVKSVKAIKVGKRLDV